MAITGLSLTGFRNHASLNLSPDGNFVVICGENGVGKTNILEAISFLAPGKGFRNASTEEIFNKNEGLLNEWAVTARLKYGFDDITLTTGSRSDTGRNNPRRVIRVNDELSYKSSELLNYLKVIWITPQTDGIFLESPGVRRKFLDRVTYNFFPLHASYIVNYEKLVKSRLKVIQEPGYDEIWISALEKQLATLNFQIFQNRTKCLNMIKEVLAVNSSNFLKPTINLVGSIDTFLRNIDDNEIEQIQEKLKSNRRIDALSGRTNFGIHKSDIEAFHPIKHIKADRCSTGEQKAMLISIILAQIKSIKQISSTPVVLLLDEVFSHLDINFRRNLIEELYALKAQAWITTANEHIIEEIDYEKTVISI